MNWFFKQKNKKKNNVNKPANKDLYLFHEPFLYFIVDKTVKEKHLVKIIQSKARFLFKTEDFFYCFKKIKNKYWIFIAPAGTWDLNEQKISWQEGSYPLLLHLKEGKYLIKGEKIFYHVDIDDQSLKIVINAAPIKGYREVTEKDLLPPKWKLKWNLNKKSFLWVNYFLMFVIFIGIIINLFLGFNIIQNGQKITRLVNKQSITKVILVHPPKGNFYKIVEEINQVGKDIRGLAYIKKAEFSKGELQLILECIEKGCIIPDKRAKANMHKSDEFEINIKIN